VKYVDDNNKNVIVENTINKDNKDLIIKFDGRFKVNNNDNQVEKDLFGEDELYCEKNNCNKNKQSFIQFNETSIPNEEKSSGNH